MASRKKVSRALSDRPADLAHEREKVVHNFLKRGVELTEQLIHENEELQHDLLALEEENTKLRTQIASDDAIRELLSRIDALEGERKALLSRSRELERTSKHFQGRSQEMEQEINDLASLHVASFQLGKALAPDRVLRHICELLEQLIGARSFAVYLVDSDVELATPLESRGMEPEWIHPINLAEGPIGDACLTGLTRMRELAGGAGSLEDPLAVLPLMAEGQTIGVIVVLALLPQKSRWAPVDRELFKLLGANGATAMIAASLYARAESPHAAIEGLADAVGRAFAGSSSTQTSDSGR